MKSFSFLSKVFLTLVCGLFLFHPSFSQGTLFNYGKYSNAEGDSLNYRILVSDYDIGSKYPLVIFLHGAGERGSDNESQLKWGVSNFATSRVMKMHRPIVIAPQCPEGESWVDYKSDSRTMKKSPTKSMQLVLDLISEAVAKYPIDTSRIYITGLSMGGFGTFDAIARRPDLFAAAVPVCGGGDASKASIMADMPIWIFHGALDGAVDAARAREMVEALTRAGGHVGYTQYPETGHFSWVAAYSDEMMIDWLFRQRR